MISCIWRYWEERSKPEKIGKIRGYSLIKFTNFNTFLHLCHVTCHVPTNVSWSWWILLVNKTTYFINVFSGLYTSSQSISMSYRGDNLYIDIGFFRAFFSLRPSSGRLKWYKKNSCIWFFSIECFIPAKSFFSFTTNSSIYNPLFHY